ncbi:oxidoreductase [Mycobacterium intermedium]|uniref:Oxidoreductase n=1 Tax=Mycobacterium intermedium TaxID=28445 RepID=A0A1E3S7P4_MYCIE|nr:oxidoreductase [Mycobacterium intermedium]MCV6965408.1 oxidoreductase [Mycobacterium intermedium]ODQ98178.1 oxidoreductase [Mycobacterium intermedium]OPE47779.1 oxidoreductase [Mycobacterium intermedium]ORA97362.1 oxidoreductase [Mycobacterium intermedium]
MVGFVQRLWLKIWHKIFSSRLLTLGGWIAFDLPRTVTAIGDGLLIGLIAVHVYLLNSQPALPGYFVGYALTLIVGCLVAAALMVGRFKHAVPRHGWYVGSFCCLVFLGVYLLSRMLSLPGLEALTGRWDLAPGTLAMTLAGGFLAVHTTVLSGINVAYPQRQGWQD